MKTRALSQPREGSIQIRPVVDNFFEKIAFSPVNKNFCNFLADLESGFPGINKNFSDFFGGLNTCAHDSLRNCPGSLASELACIEGHLYNCFANLGRSFEDRLKNLLHGQ